MILSDNILRMIKTSQKISEQMVAVNKITESIKLSENLSKVLNSSTSIGLTHKQCLSYISTANIKWATPKDINFYVDGNTDFSNFIDFSNFNGNEFFNQNPLVGISKKDIKYYGGGDFEPLGSKPFWTDLKVNNISNSHFYNNGVLCLQPSLDLFKGKSSISQLTTLNTLKTGSIQSIKDSLKLRNEVTSRVLDAFYSFEEKYDFKTNDHDYKKVIDRFLNSNHDGLYDLLVTSYARLLEYDARINFEFTKIQILNKIYKSIKIGLKKISLNKREIFRKMNSFLFKNLDDYHSLAY